jgi:hypothetical protein
LAGIVERSLLAFGADKRQYATNLPRPWVDGVGLRPGDRLTLAFDRVLVVVPPDLAGETHRVVSQLNRRSARFDRSLLASLLSGRVTSEGQ